MQTRSLLDEKKVLTSSHVQFTDEIASLAHTHTHIAPVNMWKLIDYERATVLWQNTNLSYLSCGQHPMEYSEYKQLWRALPYRELPRGDIKDVCTTVKYKLLL